MSKHLRGTRQVRVRCTHPGPTAVSPGPCLPGRTSTPPRRCVRWAPGPASRP